MRRYPQLFRENLAVSRSLVQHQNEVGILEDILDLLAGQEVFDILRDSRRDAAPLSKAFPYLHGIGRRLFLLEQQVKFVHIVTGGSSIGTVGGHPAPHLILRDQHAQLLQLFAELLDVVADQAVVDVHVGPVIKQVQGTFDVDFQ